MYTLGLNSRHCFIFVNHCRLAVRFLLALVSSGRVMLYHCVYEFPLQMDSKVPIETFEKVLELATEGAKAVATFMREVSSFIVCILGLPMLSWRWQLCCIRKLLSTSGAKEDTS